MNIKIEPCQLNGVLKAPPSKSYAHRMLIGAGLSCLLGQEETRSPQPKESAVGDPGNGYGKAQSCSVSGISDSEDMLATMDCLKALGCVVQKEGSRVTLFRKTEDHQAPEGRTTECNDPEDGTAECKTREDVTTECQAPEGRTTEYNDPEGRKPDSERSGREQMLPVFPCRESGSTLRFFIPIALAVCGGGVFRGARRLIERGIGIYEELFAERGIHVEKTENSILVRGKLSPSVYRIRGDVSSQFVTGLLFALALQKEESRIEVLPPVESRSYIDLTIDVLKQFGVPVQEVKPDTFVLPEDTLPRETSYDGKEQSSGKQPEDIPRHGRAFRTGCYQVEGDWSNAAFLYAFQTLGHDIKIEGVKNDSIQGDRACLKFLNKLKGGRSAEDGGEAAGFSRDPDEKETETIDLSDTPDLGPVLFAAAAALRGGHFTGTRRLRIKESDRAAAMAEELSKFGIQVLTGENDVVVLSSPLRKPSVPLNGHNDHRIVMALSVLAALTGAEIEGAEAVAKSWPDFFRALETVGLKWRQTSPSAGAAEESE